MQFIRFFSFLVLFLVLSACQNAKKETTEQPSPSGSTEGAPVSYPGPAQGWDVGSGGDLAGPDHGVMWFQNSDKEVHYCVAIEPGFGVSADKVNQEVTGAIGTWTKYIETRLRPIWENSEWIKINFPSLKFFKKESCDGSEDLALYFGSSDNKLEKYKAQFVNPIAYTQRLSYHRAQKWGKGFIWVAKSKAVRIQKRFTEEEVDWNKPGILRALLVHEIGHTLGNAHVPGTIMDSRIPFFLTELKWNTEETPIDLFRELVPDKNSEIDYVSTMGEAQFFESIAGRKPSGKIWLLLKRKNGKRAPFAYTLSLKDDISQVSLKLVENSEKRLPRPNVSVLPTFKYLTQDWGAAPFERFLHGTLGDSDLGTFQQWLEIPSGKKVFLQVRESIRDTEQLITDPVLIAPIEVEAVLDGEILKIATFSFSPDTSVLSPFSD